MAQVEGVARGQAVDKARDAPEILVVVVDGDEKFGPVLAYVACRSEERLVLAALDVRFDHGERLGDVVVEGGHFHLDVAAVRESVGGGAGGARRESHDALFVRNAFQAEIYPLETGERFSQRGKDLGGDLVAVDLLIAVRAVVDQIRHHAVADVCAEVRDDFVFRAFDQVEVEVVVEAIFLRLRRGVEIVAVPVGEDGKEHLFGAEIRKPPVQPLEVVDVP